MRALPPGTIDLHVHVAPDASPRSVDALELARDGALAGAVFKSHKASTAGVAALARAYAPGFEAFGSVVMNHAVGGLNSEAVLAMAQTGCGAAAIVWLPTRDAAHDMARKRRAGKCVQIFDDGLPSNALQAVVQAADSCGLVLATGHIAPAESAALARLGMRLLATHVTAGATAFSREEIAAILDAGGTAEICARNLLARRSDQAEMIPDNVAATAALIREFGHGHFVLSSDLGDPAFPKPVQGLAGAAEALARAGLGDAAIEGMLVDNPRRLLVGAGPGKR